ncbi:hypothetical protein G4228_011680 [Cervus hanglu yarkandensis]|nr:hypothetical protein G4228_011680 [Cervus hanglu yarkandensis]
MLIKDLRGTESTQDACSKMRKSTEHMKKIPTIILSITYKGVKFIDASNKNIIAEHEIRNISLRPRTQRTCVPSPTSLRTCRPAPTIATSSARWT